MFKFKYVRFDMPEELMKTSDAPIFSQVWPFAWEAMRHFRPSEKIPTDIRWINDKLKRKPLLAPLLADAFAKFRDFSDSKSGAIRQAELEETVEFVRLKVADVNGQAGVGASIHRFGVNFHLNTGKKLAYDLSTGRRIHLKEMRAAAVLFACDQCIEAALARRFDEIPALMSDMHVTLSKTAYKDYETIKTVQARIRAIEAHGISPKRKAKNAAHSLWLERRNGRHPLLRTNEQFATECLHRWPDLKSARVVLAWCTEWNKAAKLSDIESQSAR